MSVRPCVGIVVGVLISIITLLTLRQTMLKERFHIQSRVYSEADVRSCRRACDIAERYESEQVVKHLACTTLRPLNWDEGPLSPKALKITYCKSFSEPHSWYDGMQKLFLTKIHNDPKLLFTGPVLFRIEDNSTILAETGKALMRAGIPYLSHTHMISSKAADCSGQMGEKTCIYQPDFHFIENKGYQKLIRSFQKISTPLRKRKKMVFWRGASTGISSDCESLLRTRMCSIAEHVPWLDLKITKHVQCCHDIQSINASYVSEIKWAQFRGVIDVDGNVNAWGLFWRLASGSVVFRIHSQYANYYTSQMIPWVHYIPLSNDLSDIKERTRVVTLDGKSSIELELISANAQRLVERISYAAELLRVRNELNLFKDQSSSHFLNLIA